MADQKITKKQYETAVYVMSQSRMVRKWLEGEARAFNVDLDNEAGRKFIQKRGKEIATRLVR